MFRPLSRLPVLAQLALAFALLLLLVTWSSSSFGSPTPASSLVNLLHHPLQKLSDALDRLEKTPIASYEEALRYNEKTCRGRGVQSNRDQINGESEFWKALTAETIREKRESLVQTVREAFNLNVTLHQAELTAESARLFNDLYGRGRGIVFTGGNAVSSTFSWRASLQTDTFP